MPYIEIFIALLVVGLIIAVVRQAKKSAGETIRADQASKTSDVALAAAEPVSPAKNKEELKNRAKRRRDRIARRGH